MVNENATTSVLLALNDTPTSMVMSYHLERYGFIVNSARTNESLLETAERIEPNIVILDEDLPGDISSMATCNSLKKKTRTKNTAMIFAAKTEIENSSIDAFIKKPFSPSELVNKIKAFAKKNTTATKKILCYHDIEMDVNALKITRFGKTIHLGPTEFKILQCLLELPGRILSRDHIKNYVWGHNSQVEPRTIDVHINRLRNALKDHGDEVPLIRTIRASGYSLNAPRELVRV